MLSTNNISYRGFEIKYPGKLDSTPKAENCNMLHRKMLNSARDLNFSILLTYCLQRIEESFSSIKWKLLNNCYGNIEKMSLYI